MTTPKPEVTCAPDAPVSNESVQWWIDSATRFPEMGGSHIIILLGRELLRARRDLAVIASRLQNVAKDLDSLKEDLDSLKELL